MSLARQLAEDGMQLALFNEPEEWRRNFLAFIEAQAEKLPFFKVEDLRSDWLAAGNPAPHSPKVYGAIGRLISTRKIGEFIGYVNSVSPKTHAHPVKHYRSLKFKGAQHG